MVFSESIESYTKNLGTAFSFALLLVFVLPISFLSGAFISSGTGFIEHGFLKEPVLNTILLLVFVLAFLYFYSLLVCLMVFAVRKDLSSMKMALYLDEKIQSIALHYFAFLLLFVLIGSLAVSILVEQGIEPVLINFILMLVSLAFLFLPQTIVVDEESLGSSVARNFEYIGKHSGDFLVLFALGFFSVLFLQVLEFVIDYFFLFGNFVSLLIALVFFVPFFEVLKTRFYMKRFSLIETYHYSHSK